MGKFVRITSVDEFFHVVDDDGWYGGRDPEKYVTLRCRGDIITDAQCILQPPLGEICPKCIAKVAAAALKELRLIGGWPHTIRVEMKLSADKMHVTPYMDGEQAGPPMKLRDAVEGAIRLLGVVEKAGE